MTADPIACHQHPDVTRQVLECRFCKTPVCIDCREPRSLSGTGITIQVCTTCIRKEQRSARVRQLAIVAAIGAVIAVIAATSIGPVYAIVPLVLAALWIIPSIGRYRSGSADTRDALRLGLIISRFLR
jgi:hypothetical protein